jgi:ABC-2 type transport system ATP-binding protein
MISTKGLRKTFSVRKHGRTVMVDAVRGIDLQVSEHEIFGFLGPNGAGKTTTLRMLATLIVPDGGTAAIAGADLLRAPAEIRRCIGYVAQGRSVSDAMTPREELILQGRLHGMKKFDAQRRADQLLQDFHLGECAQRHCITLSGGQRRRVEIALGLVHRPTLLFLDEPTAGLDPQSRAHLWGEIRRMCAEGMTVFMTTHYLDEADSLCDRVAIMDHGEIVAQGTPAALKQQISGDIVTVELSRSAPTLAVVRGTELVVASGETREAAKLFERQPYLRSLEVSKTGFRLYVDAAATAIPQIVLELNRAGLALESIEVHRPSLDDVFLAKTGRSLREA